MKHNVAPRLTLGLMLLSLLASVACADTLVVGGRRSQSRVPLVVQGDEIYAPLLPALDALHATHQVTPDQIKIITANGREILIDRRRPQASRDGMVRDLPGIPIAQRGALLLPARAVGSLLGCAVRWHQASRTLYLHPWVRGFTLEVLSDRYRLTVAADAPITYRTGELANPPRLFLDLLNMDLSQIPAAYTVEDSYLKGARISQNSLAPQPPGDVARVVVEMTERRKCRIGESDDKCKLWLDFPLPDATEIPPDVPPVIITGVTFERTSSRVAQLKLATYGRPYCTALTAYDPTEVIFDIANAQSQLGRQPIEVSDRVIGSVAIEPARRNPGAQRVTVKLREPIGHSLQIGDDGLTVLFGQFDLAELRVVVDAGHGGHDTGAIGRAGVEEREVNLDIARRVYQKLLAMGVSACMTRSDEASVVPWTAGNREEQRQDLLARCAAANNIMADLFVSVHANAHPGNPYEHRGTETYYRKEDSLEFARAMQREVVAQTGLPDGGVIRHPKSIIVLSHTDMPAVLVEVAYLSHPDDEALLATEAFRERAAQGVVNGIRRYVEEGGLLTRLAERERSKARQEAGQPD